LAALTRIPGSINTAAAATKTTEGAMGCGGERWGLGGGIPVFPFGASCSGVLCLPLCCGHCFFPWLSFLSVPSALLRSFTYDAYEWWENKELGALSWVGLDRI